MDKATLAYIQQIYESVFELDGSIKACGRQACSKLITVLQPYAPVDLGDAKTGIMNVENIHKVYKMLCAE